MPPNMLAWSRAQLSIFIKHVSSEAQEIPDPTLHSLTLPCFRLHSHLSPPQSSLTSMVISPFCGIWARLKISMGSQGPGSLTALVETSWQLWLSKAASSCLRGKSALEECLKSAWMTQTSKRGFVLREELWAKPDLSDVTVLETATHTQAELHAKAVWGDLRLATLPPGFTD